MLAWWEALGSKEQAGVIAALFGGIFGLVGGVLSPLLKSWFEERISDRRLRHERELLRQQKVIDAQSLMLDELANIFWTWRYLAMRVAYYGCYVREDEYKAAAVAYKSEIWGVLSKLRFSTSRMRRLFSETSFEQLRAFYLEVISIDDQINAAMQEVDPITRQNLFNEINSMIFDKVTAEINQLLFGFAHDANLVSVLTKG
jgi:hypothetical protein